MQLFHNWEMVVIVQRLQLFLVLLFPLLRVLNWGVIMENVKDYNKDGKLDWKDYNKDRKLDWKDYIKDYIKDYNKDGKLDWKDYIFYGMTIAGNIIFTIINVLH